MSAEAPTAHKWQVSAADIAWFHRHSINAHGVIRIGEDPDWISNGHWMAKSPDAALVGIFSLLYLELTQGLELRLWRTLDKNAPRLVGFDGDACVFMLMPLGDPDVANAIRAKLTEGAQ